MSFKKIIQKINWLYVIIIALIIVIISLLYNYPDCYIKTEEFDEKSEKFDGKSENEAGPESESAHMKGEIILYYASWCGYSRQFLSEWTKFEEYAKSNLQHLKVSRIRCESDNEALCFQKGIEGYPTVILYPANDTEVLFTKERSTEKLIEFVKETLNI
jgi:thiol-disulfide isomerase/thioredoxin